MGVDFEERLADYHQPGVVHQGVDAPVAFHHQLHSRLHLGFLGDVAGNAKGLAAHGLYLGAVSEAVPGRPAVELGLEQAGHYRPLGRVGQGDGLPKPRLAPVTMATIPFIRMQDLWLRPTPSASRGLS